MAKKITVGDLVISSKAKKYVREVLESNRLSYGPFSKRFEQTFAKKHQSKFAVFCNSGTMALQVAVQALKEREGWNDGDEVVVPRCGSGLYHGGVDRPVD